MPKRPHKLPSSAPHISGRKRGKYNSVKTEVEGQVFDSRGEAAQWIELREMEKARRISGLRRGKAYNIVINGQKVCSYTPDFEFVGEHGGWVVMDYKGFRTPVYNLKKKLMKAVFGIEIAETGPATRPRRRK